MPTFRLTAQRLVQHTCEVEVMAETEGQARAVLAERLDDGSIGDLDWKEGIVSDSVMPPVEPDVRIGGEIIAYDVEVSYCIDRYGNVRVPIAPGKDAEWALALVRAMIRSKQLTIFTEDGTVIWDESRDDSTAESLEVTGEVNPVYE